MPIIGSLRRGKSLEMLANLLPHVIECSDHQRKGLVLDHVTGCLVLRIVHVVKSIRVAKRGVQSAAGTVSPWRGILFGQY